MNIRDLKDSLEYLFKAEVTPFIWGHAGVGKSSAIKQYAEDKGYKFFPFYLGTQSDLGDILGLASFVKDENGSEVATRFAIPLFIKDMVEYCEKNPESGAIIFLDEFNRARRDILNGMFSFALDKTFHTIRLPKNCYVVAAGNPPTEEYYTTDVNDTALMSRFVHIKLEPAFSEWEQYALAKKYNPDMIGFLKEQPSLLQDEKATFELPVKVDSRSYERLHKLETVNTPTHLYEQLAAGIIGIERLVSYKKYKENADKPLTANEVFTASSTHKLVKWSNPTNVQSSLLTSTCDNVYQQWVDWDKTGTKTLTESQRVNFLEFIKYLPGDILYAFGIRLVESSIKLFDDFQREPRNSDILCEQLLQKQGQRAA